MSIVNALKKVVDNFNTGATNESVRIFEQIYFYGKVNKVIEIINRIVKKIQKLVCEYKYYLHKIDFIL